MRVRVRAATADLAERLAAEAFEAGAQGLEERSVGDVTELLIYLPPSQLAAVTHALTSAGAGPDTVEPVEEQNWSEAWKTHLSAIEVSDRLVVRPSFVPFACGEGQHEIVIDPGQAFGTGNHESTRLALEWVSRLAPDLAPGARVLDVGLGTAVLALAALRLGPARAVGFDLDPLAPEAARENAQGNGLADRMHCFTGGIEALRPGLGFDLVLANLLRREVEPILPALATHVAPGGAAVLSGLLERERAEVEVRARAVGLREAGARRRVDESGVAWVALRMERMG